MIDIVNFIRNNPEEFTEWHNSDTAKLFSPEDSKPKCDTSGENIMKNTAGLPSGWGA